MARGEAGPKSDVDLLIEVDPAARPSARDAVAGGGRGVRGVGWRRRAGGVAEAGRCYRGELKLGEGIFEPQADQRQEHRAHRRHRRPGHGDRPRHGRKGAIRDDTDGRVGLSSTSAMQLLTEIDDFERQVWQNASGSRKAALRTSLRRGHRLRRRSGRRRRLFQQLATGPVVQELPEPDHHRRLRHRQKPGWRARSATTPRRFADLALAPRRRPLPAGTCSRSSRIAMAAPRPCSQASCRSAAGTTSSASRPSPTPFSIASCPTPSASSSRARAAARAPLYGLRGRAATRLTRPQQPATLATAAASCRCRPASSESVAAFDRTRRPASAGFSARLIRMGIMTPMLGIGREKLGKPAASSFHHPMPTYASYMTRFDWQRKVPLCHQRPDGCYVSPVAWRPLGPAVQEG